MTITISKDSKIFHLQTARTSYQMQIGRFGQFLHLYYGRKIPTTDLDFMLENVNRHFSPYPYDGTILEPESFDIAPQEFPTKGTGDLRTAAVVLENADGTQVVDLVFKSYEISRGKYKLSDLPSFFASDEEVESLKVTLIDKVSQIEVDLLYGVFSDKDVITRSVCVRNLGVRDVFVRQVQSLS